MSRWGRRTLLAAAALLTLLLSGCLRYQVELTVSDEDRVSGTIVFAIFQASGAPDNPPRHEIPDEFADKVTLEPYEQDSYVGEKATLDNLTFDEVERFFVAMSVASDPHGSAPDDLPPPPGQSSSPGSEPRVPADHSTLSFQRDGDTLTVRGETDIPFLRPTDNSQPLENFDSSISLTFPGDVVSTNGEKDGRTVTWTVALDKPTTIEAEVNLPAGGGGGSDDSATMTYALIGGGALLVLIIAGVVVFLVRRRHAAVPAAAGPAFSAADFQTFIDDRSWYPPEAPGAAPADPYGSAFAHGPGLGPPGPEGHTTVPPGPGLGTPPADPYGATPPPDGQPPGGPGGQARPPGEPVPASQPGPTQAPVPGATPPPAQPPFPPQGPPPGYPPASPSGPPPGFPPAGAAPATPPVPPGYPPPGQRPPSGPPASGQPAAPPPGQHQPPPAPGAPGQPAVPPPGQWVQPGSPPPGQPPAGPPPASHQPPPAPGAPERPAVPPPGQWVQPGSPPPGQSPADPPPGAPPAGPPPAQPPGPPQSEDPPPDPYDPPYWERQ